MENTRENNRTWSYDKIDFQRFNEHGIAELGRLYHDLPSLVNDDHTRIPLPIVAKGITAFLADGSMSSFRHVIYYGLQVVDAEVFFDEYYQHCFKFLKINDRNKSPLKYKWKSVNVLINEHLKTEKELFEESQIFYNEYREEHREIIETIKETALYYPEWVKINLHLNDEVQNTVIESFKSPKLLKPTKTFPEYLMHDKRELLAEKLKTEFNTERGKGIRLLIESLQANEPQLLSTGNRQATAVYQSLKLFFNRDIGSYQSIFDYEYDIKNDAIDFKAVKLKLDFILNQINNTK